MKRNQQLEAVLDELGAVGIKPVVQLNSHYKVRWYNSSGQERTLVLASTPGGGRGVNNARAMARRMLRQDGVLA